MVRSIFVIGPQGSGSSAIAGAMQTLGISMGLELKGKSDLNPKGHFECLVFEKLAMAWVDDYEQIITNLAEVKEVFKGYVMNRNQEGLWGLKMPLMISFVPFMIPYVNDCRIISIDRPFEGCVKSSIQKYPGKTREFIEDLHNTIRLRRADLIERYSLPNLDVDYNELTSNTTEVMNRVVDFCFEDMVRPTDEIIAASVDFVDPSLNHKRENS